MHLLLIFFVDDVFSRKQCCIMHIFLLTREIEAFKGWPVERVLDHPHDCLFHFFKRGAVMVPDSKNSEWLYIVKTGE